ncbi:MAG TPA: hypothetical protein VJR29_05485 [bacterium]|nr:hypothetical protein [bacterium]
MEKIRRFLPALTFLALTACFSARESGPKNSARVELHQHGIIIEAKYEPALDNLVPGYKIVTVGLTNNGTDILKLNPLRDRWEIVDATGQKRKAYNSLRIKDPAIWSRLPGQMKEMVEYPVAVAMGYSETLDLFFPSTVDISDFRSISFYSAERKETYDILQLDNREVPATEVEPRQTGDGAPAPRSRKKS